MNAQLINAKAKAVNGITALLLAAGMGSAQAKTLINRAAPTTAQIKPITTRS